MKRAAFILVWTGIFATAIFGAWMIAWDWLTRSGIATVWAQELVDWVQAFAYLTYIAVPLLGMTLALLGKLPGTRLVKTQT